jgi:ABC-type multidrug transport system fused ATPase/permease subunit
VDAVWDYRVPPSRGWQARHSRGRADREAAPSGADVLAATLVGGAGEATEGTTPDATTPEVTTPALPVRVVFARFWPDTRGFRLALLVGTALIGLGVPLETVSIWLFKLLVDGVLAPADFSAFPPLAAAYVGLTLVGGAVSFASRQVMTRVSESFLLALRTRLFAHLHTLSMDFFERSRLGDLLSRVGGDVAAIEGLVLSGVSVAISAGLRVVVYAVMLFVLDPTLAATAVLVSPLLWLISRVFARRLKAASRRARQQVGNLSSIAEESLSTVALVQAYNRQDDEVRRFRDEGRRVVDTALRTSRLRGLYSPLVELVELSGLMLVIGYGTWQLARHHLTLGDLLVFLAYFAQLYGPLRGLAQLGNSFSSAAAGAERIIEVLDARPAVLDHPAAPALPRSHGVVEFRDVSFSYPGRDHVALSGVSFTARPGQLIAVVGRSGSGKSTLGKLLLRFHDPVAGSVTLDGHDLRDLRLADLRRHVAAVLQETQVMDGTILENILWGRPDADPDDVARALAGSDVDTVIAELPEGAATRAGYRGRRLSGGQRQRVAIARAMVRDAPVLLLDEPATGLDPVSERRVLAPLQRLISGRTTILISHNLLAVRDADLILVLDHGQVVESGTHHELTALRGHYHQLCLAQQAEAGPDERSDPSCPAPSAPTSPTSSTCVAPATSSTCATVSGTGSPSSSTTIPPRPRGRRARRPEPPPEAVPEAPPTRGASSPATRPIVLPLPGVRNWPRATSA